MQFNKQLALEVLCHIVAHPEQWNQEVWSCGTAHCFAGHVAWKVNGPFQVKENENYDPEDDEEYEKYIPIRNGMPIDIQAEAKDALGIGYNSLPLFYHDNDLEIIAYRIEQLSEAYA